MSDGSDGGATPARWIVPEATSSPAPPPRLDRRATAALWALLLAFSLTGVFGRSLWGANDAREGGMIWDMVRHGVWVTPTIDGRPFLEKPPLLHWTAIALCRAAGRVTEGLVRLPAALYGFGTLALLVLLVRGPRAAGEGPAEDGRELAAWSAAFLCATAAQFQEYARVVLTDMALVFMVTLSLWSFWRAWVGGGAARWAAFLAAAAASFYAKGLIGPALVWAAVGSFLLWRRRLRLLAALAGAYLPLLALAVLPWVAALRGFAGDAAVRFAFWDNQVGRFFRFSDPSLPADPFFINKEPWHYYLRVLPAYLAPWTLLLVPAAIAWTRRRSPFRTPFHQFVACALLGMAVVLQAASAKVANYALPMYPLVFAAVGIWLAEVVTRRATGLERWTARATGAALGLTMALAAVAFVGGTVAYPELFRAGGPVRTGVGLATAALLLVLTVAAVVGVVRLARSPARGLTAVAAPAAYAVLVAVALEVATPAIDRQRSYRPVAGLAARESARGAEVALASSAYRDVGAFTFYLDRRLPLLDGPEAVAAYLSAPGPRLVIAPRELLPALETHLAAVPHDALTAGSPGTVSRSFVVLANGAEREVAGRAAEPPAAGTVREAEAVRGDALGVAAASAPPVSAGRRRDERGR